MLNRRDFNWGAAVAGFGAVTTVSSGVAKAATEPTLSLNVVYPNHEGAKFDMNYYRDTHIPLAMKVMKADKVMLIEGVPNGDVPAPFVMICHFEFASADALKAAMTNPAMADVRADVAKVTDIKPTVMLGKSL
jgi:uncharacterized protein (TIGR02118 family)